MEVNFNRQTIISFPDNPELSDITTGIADGSLVVDEILFTDRFTIGTCNSNRFEVELYNFPTIGNIKIYAYQIVDEVEGEEPVEKPLFTGYVDSCVTNRGRFEDSKQIVAYDALYTKATMDVSAWWEEVFDTSTQVTVKELRESLCEYVGIDYEEVTLPNDDVLITQTQQLNTISFQSMLTYIMQINAANAKIDRSGVLNFFVIADHEPIAIDTTYAQNTTEFDTYTVPAFEAVRIVNSTEGVVAYVGADYNCFQIQDNLLLLDKNQSQLESIAQNILTVIGEITYNPAQIDMIYSNLDIEVGYRVKIGLNVYLVCENVYSGSQLVDERISSIGQNTIEESAATYDASKKDMQDKISASSLKYYKYQNLRAISINTSRPIISIRYSTSEDGVVIFHGCVIFDVEIIDDSLPATVVLQYNINDTIIREYTPTETYFNDGRHTMNIMHFWDASANTLDKFVVTMIPTNCKVTIGAFRVEGYMEGMGLVGDAKWDGFVEVEDNIVEITNFATAPLSVIEIGDDVEVTAVDPIRLTFTDEAEICNFATTPVPITIREVLYLNKYPLYDLTWAEVAQMTWNEVLNGFLW